MSRWKTDPVNPTTTVKIWRKTAMELRALAARRRMSFVRLVDELNNLGWEKLGLLAEKNRMFGGLDLAS